VAQHTEQTTLSEHVWVMSATDNRAKEMSNDTIDKDEGLGFDPMEVLVTWEHGLLPSYWATGFPVLAIDETYTIGVTTCLPMRGSSEIFEEWGPLGEVAKSMWVVLV
jgi:hypothetical protein